MQITTCPRCHTPGVEERYSARTGRPYFANVETYPSGRSYFRGLHTREACAEALTKFNATVQEKIDRDAADRAEAERMARGATYARRYVAIYGPDAMRENWDRVNARWLTASAA